MKVCFFCYDISHYGGVRTVVKEIIESLKPDLDIYICSLVGSIGEDLADQEHRIELKKPEERLITMRKKYNQVINKEFNDHGFDVVIAVQVYAGFVSFQMGGKHPRLILWDHGAIVNQLSDKKVTLMRFFLSVFCDRIVTLTDRTNDDYHRFFLTSRKKLVTTYNPIPQSIIAKSKTAKHEYHRIISAGRISRLKLRKWF